MTYPRGAQHVESQQAQCKAHQTWRIQIRGYGFSTTYNDTLSDDRTGDAEDNDWFGVYVTLELYLMSRVFEVRVNSH